MTRLKVSIGTYGRFNARGSIVKDAAGLLKEGKVNVVYDDDDLLNYEL